MNRVIIHIAPDHDTMIKRRRDHLREALEHIQTLTGGIVEIFISPDCVPCYSICHGLDDSECGIQLQGVEGAESIIAAELRTFADLCNQAADNLEGGAA